MLKIKVENMTSNSSGREVPNQFIIRTDEGTYFQSYSTVIAFVPFNRMEQTLIDRDKWDYSMTTSKYRNKFLSERTKDTLAKIKSGEYLLADLN